MIFLVSGLNYLVDPYQHYRISNWYKIQNNLERYVVSGIAKNAQYETVLIGSSVTQNTSVSQLEKNFSTSAIKLTAPALKSYEMNEILKNIFESQKNIKNIIINLDDFALKEGPPKNPSDTLPMYLFDEDIVNDYKYLLSLSTLKQSIISILNFQLQQQNFDQLWFWSGAVYSRQIVFDFYKKNGSKTLVSHGSSQKNNLLNQMKNNFERYLLPYIILHRSTEFYIYYPPYSYLYIHDNFTKDDLNFKIYLFKLAKIYKNIKIFDYQCSEMVYKLENYKDSMHFSDKYNKVILDDIAIDKKYTVTQTSELSHCDKVILDIMDTPIVY